MQEFDVIVIGGGASGLMCAMTAGQRGRRVLISQGYIPTSRTSMAMPWWTERHSFENLDGMLRQLRAYARSPGRAYAYAYWPFYDTHCHEHGPCGRIPARHLGEIDAWPVVTNARISAREIDVIRGHSGARIQIGTGSFVPDRHAAMLCQHAKRALISLPRGQGGFLCHRNSILCAAQPFFDNVKRRLQTIQKGLVSGLCLAERTNTFVEALEKVSLTANVQCLPAAQCLASTHQA